MDLEAPVERRESVGQAPQAASAGRVGAALLKKVAITPSRNMAVTPCSFTTGQK